MKIVVCAKYTAAISGQPVLSADSRSVEDAYLNWGHNEWDLCAVEEALRIREQEGGEGEVVVITVGRERSETTVRWCLAMGADRGIRIDAYMTDPIHAARALAAAIKPEQPDLVLVGAQSSDGLNAATGGALAAFLGVPFVAFVTAIELNSAEPRAIVRRELEGGLSEMLEVEIPAVLSIQTGINDPRYVTLRGRRRAAEKTLSVTEAHGAIHPSSVIRRITLPRSERRAQILTGDPPDTAAQIASTIRTALG